MEEAHNKAIPVAERFAQMVLAEAICVAALLLAALGVRYLFTGYRQDAEEWYRQNLCVETDVDEVLTVSEEEHAV